MSKKKAAGGIPAAAPVKVDQGLILRHIAGLLTSTVCAAELAIAWFKSGASVPPSYLDALVLDLNKAKAVLDGYVAVPVPSPAPPPNGTTTEDQT